MIVLAALALSLLAFPALASAESQRVSVTWTDSSLACSNAPCSEFSPVKGFYVISTDNGETARLYLGEGNSYTNIPNTRIVPAGGAISEGQTATLIDLEAQSTRRFWTGFQRDTLSSPELTIRFVDPGGAIREDSGWYTHSPHGCAPTGSTPYVDYTDPDLGFEWDPQACSMKPRETAGTNSRPCASSDTYSVAPGAKLEVPSSLGLLANDFDPDRDQIRVVLKRTSFGASKLKLNPASGAFAFRAGPKPSRARITYVAKDTKGAASSPASALIFIGRKSEPMALAPCANGRALQGKTGDVVGARSFSEIRRKTIKERNGRQFTLTLEVNLTVFRWVNYVEVRGASAISASQSIKHLCIGQDWTIYTEGGFSSLRPISPWEDPVTARYPIDYVEGRHKVTDNGVDWFFRGPQVERARSKYAGIGFSSGRGALSWISADKRIGDVHLTVTGRAGSTPGCGGKYSRALTWSN